MKKAFITLFILLSLFPLSMQAQDYKKLWAQANTFAEKDLPKSALGVVEQIRAKALAEGDDGQLLAATLSQFRFETEISSDSTDAVLARMEAALAAEQRPAVCALWHAALAKTYAGIYRDDAVQTEKDEEQKETHIAASLADLDALSKARAADYLPLFREGSGSSLYDGDLLHVIVGDYCDESLLTDAEQQTLRHRCAALYEAQGRRSAALLMALDSLKLEYEDEEITLPLDANPYYQGLVRLAADYEKEAANAHTYTTIVGLRGRFDDEERSANGLDSLFMRWAESGIRLYPKTEEAKELRNACAAMQQPTARLDELPSEAYPADTLTLRARVRNYNKVSLRLTPIFQSSIDARQHGTAKERKALAEKNRGRAVTYDFPLTPGLAPHDWQTVEQCITLPKAAAVYYVQLLADGRAIDDASLTITRLAALTLATSKDTCRVVAVDRKSGAAVAGATITEWRAWNGSVQKIKDYTTDADGAVSVQGKRNDHARLFSVSTEGDESASLFRAELDYAYGYSGEDRARTVVEVFTDRAIYRPGQEVGFSAVVYTKRGDAFSVEKGFQARAELRDVNNQLIDSLVVQTDDFGALSGAFRLPEACLTGRFIIRVKGRSQSGATSLRVEEYKRPTFTATTDPVTVAYALGDTVRVSGKAATYSGVPVGGARVQWSVTRRTWWWFDGDEVDDQHGETVTADDGTFTLPVALLKSRAAEHSTRFNRYTYVVTYTVTAPTGETAEGQTALSVATRPSWLEGEVPETIYRSAERALPTFCIKRVNAAGRNIASAGTYSLLYKQREQTHGTFRTDTAFTIEALATLPSGAYTLRFASEGVDTLERSFLLLSENDTRPVDSASPFFCYVDRADDGAARKVLFGSPLPHATLFFSIISEEGLVRAERFVLTDSLVSEALAYREEYGDGAVAVIALVRDGRFFSERIEIPRPEPDKRLLLTWQTFRSRLTPGADEEWTLSVRRPDGSAADAQVMAALYDASLDAFTRHAWGLSGVTFSRTLPGGRWCFPNAGNTLRISGAADLKRLRYDAPDFTRWDEQFFDGVGGRHYFCLLGGRPYGLARAESVMMEMSTADSVAPMEPGAMRQLSPRAKQIAINGSVSFAEEDAGSTDAASGEASTTSSGVALRQNFNETAFFRPGLATDDEGNVRLRFTLPDCVTQWNFLALAHDRTMSHGTLRAEVVAAKDFMVEPALPRFVRSGDEAALPVRVTNLSDRTVNATLTLTLTDALTGKQVDAQKQKITLAPGAVETYAFTHRFEGASGVLVCRAVAEGSGFSDGEERYLPVLADEVEMTRSVPFYLTEKGTRTLSVDTLFALPGAAHRTLSVELTSNPTWNVVGALPAMVGEGTNINAIDWATTLYALTLGQDIAQRHPEIRTLLADDPTELDAYARLKAEGMNDLTPWLRNAESEQSRRRALRNLFDPNVSAANIATAFGKLSALQGADGAWAWFPGMEGSAFVTAEVSVTLARLSRVASLPDDQQRALDRGFAYLKKEVAKEIREMKKWEKKYNEKLQPSEEQLRYLYLRVLLDEQPDADARFLIERMLLCPRDYTILGKARTALILDHAGHRAEAETALQSIMEFSVTSPEMGRYFDTRRAQLHYAAYRIPSQCAAIEALDHFGRQTALDEMRLWLLQSKRTQMWESPRASVDAVYALLATGGQSAADRVTALTDTEPLLYTLYKKNKIVAANAPSESATPQTVGHVRQTFTEQDAAIDATQLRVTKRNDGLSWGSVRATMTVPLSAVPVEGRGLTVTSTMQVKRGDDWVDLDPSATLRPGDRVRQVFTLTADRDCDFVCLTAQRAACMEPVDALSGYDWQGGVPAYRAVRDNRTEYFFHHLAKGRHQFTTDYFIDRTGVYTLGVSTVECVYAPEYRGTDASRRLRVGE